MLVLSLLQANGLNRYQRQTLELSEAILSIKTAFFKYYQ